uniref:Uncharacterized protein TCIL3000_9_5540 n=1 Tax=Trypanosoma congolense (strain IL3000) TaxID=1068625 RepID=G0UUT2_TRYCI|nr:unnamed protein product [Trypanosoma congolense IL3000]
MTKDMINLRYSMKHTQGAVETEDAIGITELRSLVTRCKDAAEERGLRLKGLVKWSFDDYIVKETWHPNKHSESAAGLTRAKKVPVPFVVSVTSEGVPDDVVADLIEKRCPSGTRVRFLAPIDFCSSHTRFALVQNDSHDCKNRFKHDRMMQAEEGIVCVGRAIDVPPHGEGHSTMPLSLLPDTEYSLIFRGVRGSLADVLPRLEALQSHGFINYTHLARHGVGLFRSFESGRQLIHRDYEEFLRGYVTGLTERSPLIHKELPPLLEALADWKSRPGDWVGVRKGLLYALKRDEPLITRPQTGLYYPHHHLLRDLVERAADLFPRNHDSAQLIREGVPRLILQEKLRSVADVHFNALASFRWRLFGDKVVPGDLVLHCEEQGSDLPVLDVFDAPADHFNGCMTSARHIEWLSTAGDSHLDALLKHVRVVQSEEEARHFSIDDVVLPVLGRGAQRLLLPNTKVKKAFEQIALELQVEGLPQMRAAPTATYRRLIARPKDFAYCLFDDARGWCWESDNSNPIKPQLYEDQEGILRQPSPLMTFTGKNMIARQGIRGREQRSYFLKPARRSGMTCVLRMTLRRGAHITSALREVFQLATLDTGAIFKLLR